MSGILFGETMVPSYIVRLYPPFGYTLYSAGTGGDLFPWQGWGDCMAFRPADGKRAGHEDPHLIMS